MATPIPAPQKTDEKIFLVIVISLAVVAGIGSWFAAAAFARHDQVRGILPDKERTLGEFSLTDENGWTVTRAELEGLMVKLGATTGVTAIVETDKEFNVWVPLAAIRLQPDIEPRFVLHVLRSDNLRRAYENTWTYGTQQTLGLQTISNLRIPLPPKQEREEIAKYIDSILPAFESLSAEAQRAIDLLQERRTALISAAVTGQIDVRTN